jgi:hypothetical protein
LNNTYSSVTPNHNVTAVSLGGNFQIRFLLFKLKTMSTVRIHQLSLSSLSLTDGTGSVSLTVLLYKAMLYNTPHIPLKLSLKLLAKANLSFSLQILVFSLYMLVEVASMVLSVFFCLFWK